MDNLDIDELSAKIVSSLIQMSGEEVARIANDVMIENIMYIGDGFYTVE